MLLDNCQLFSMLLDRLLPVSDVTGIITFALNVAGQLSFVSEVTEKAFACFSCY